ncbi:MAG: ABC transporter permease subunit, partial [Gammaproteobacteria bacterium]|nr:ABC transporter permease subunit [Gammaproteobacteria bacterium]
MMGQLAQPDGRVGSFAGAKLLATIAQAEWQLWLRSRLALCTLLIFALLLASTSVVTALRMSEEHHGRTEQQAVAEETFLSQPDRHPHRMVHYGHYVFRVPPPLSMIDPGVDSVTGQSMFLEGHQQNTAMFADARASAELGGFEDLTTALVYQLFLPLLLIAIGHGLIVREREENTLVPLLAQGVTGTQLYAAKGIALAGLSLALLLPLAVMCAFAIAQGAAPLASLGVLALYALYLLVWCSLILLVSSLAHSRSLALGILALFWLGTALIVPRFAVESASSAIPAPSKIETDLNMQAELREVGDGHDAGA